MQDVVLGLLAVLAGALLCFRGYWALRLALSMWGAFVGFSLGAGIESSASGDGYLTTWLGWVVAVVLAVLFAAIAYVYYAVAVVVAMGSAGFVLGSAAMVALDVSWSWVPIAVGVVVGVLVAALAIMVQLPSILLVVVSGTAGATAVVTGLMLLTGAIDTADFESRAVTSRVDHEGWWAVLALVIAVVGIVSQVRAVGLDQGARRSWSGRTNPTGAH
ncbi:DUF4203 domain-containing protein [Aeromicrobium yanjiei]|uniref:DUF4203 domain-containing protein n=1 Tax=Aeromicrobium yanjiei TaxID=2662028 RepID=A0A5Q2MNW0_9ACTN|nr:DUF4203 domain-containing protein [Aeromicrobium yanjiei]QGG42205.1 DUF4203 domain-containing protein [Aeromicrobium yanjiei]